VKIGEWERAKGQRGARQEIAETIGGRERGDGDAGSSRD
jgi:hypothetical protein